MGEGLKRAVAAAKATRKQSLRAKAEAHPLAHYETEYRTIRLTVTLGTYEDVYLPTVQVIREQCGQEPADELIVLALCRALLGEVGR